MNSTNKITLLKYSPISLKEMKDIRLMNRTDTKYVMSSKKLSKLLALAYKDYFVQEIDGERIMLYATNYLDTSNKDMYIMHQNGRYVREKIRIRSYVSSNLSFLEVKNKNNKGCTSKKRIPMSSSTLLVDDDGDSFLKESSDNSNDSEYGLWTELDFKKEITKKLDLSFGGEFRTKDKNK